MKKAYLILENGRVFEGEAFGADVEAVGELVFNTEVVGYIENITDPAYKGQILLQTFPLIGNYGVIDEDIKGKAQISAYVVREWCKAPSNFRSNGTLDEWLVREGIPGIAGVDTREITRIIREEGVMNAKIAYSADACACGLKDYKISGAVSQVSCDSAYTVAATGEKKYSVTLVDYGTKQNLPALLADLGCEVKVVPYNTKAADILAGSPDGVVLSEGPGDPAENTEAIAEIAELYGKVPMMACGLGHQMLAIARGAETYKLKYGHRGGNQPVSQTDGDKTWITSQNHGYAVCADSVKGDAKVNMVNANDGTVMGIDYPEAKAFSVQFHPESAASPLTPNVLFEKFVNLMK